MKIASKITSYFVALNLAAMIIATAFFYVTAKIYLQKSIYNNLAAVLVSRVDHLKTYLRMIKVTVELLSNNVILEDLLEASGREDSQSFGMAKKVLNATKEASPEISEFLLMDRTGKVVVSTNESSIGLDKSTDAAFLGAQKQTYIRDVHYSKIDKEFLMAASTPLGDSQTGEVSGVLAMTMKLDKLNGIVAQAFSMSDTLEIHIINKYGYIITPSRFKGEDAVMKKKVSRQVRLHRDRKYGLSRMNDPGFFYDHRGVRVLGMRESIPEMQWGVLVEIDVKEAFLPLIKLRTAFLLILLIIPIVTWILSAYVSMAITHPLRKLREGTEIISRGNLDYKISIDTKDEVGQLSRAFNMMMENLKSSTTSIGKLQKEITAREEAEYKMRQSEEKHRVLYESSRDAIMTLEPPSWFFTSGNQATVEMFVVKDETEFMAQSPGTLSPKYQPDGKPSGEKALEMIGIAMKNGSHFFEWTHKRATGEEFFTTVLLTKVTLAQKEFLQATIRDISEQKKAEEKIKQALKDELKFRETMISLLDDNNQVREKLEKSLEKLKETQIQVIQLEKMEAVGRMASGVAHEVKNPLGIILQGINYFERVLPPEEKNQGEMLQMMKDGVTRADRIVRGLLDFARAEKLKLDSQDINTAIETSALLIQHKFKRNSIELVRELGKDLPKARMDKGKIEQVLVNLFENAADAMPKGGKLYVRSYVLELKMPRIKVGRRGEDILKLGEKAIIVEVEDTGAGIEKDIINKIFDPFFTTKNRAEGTGLGLSVARSIIEMHEGLIEVESEKGGGTKFTLTLKIF